MKRSFVAAAVLVLGVAGSTVVGGAALDTADRVRGDAGGRIRPTPESFIDEGTLLGHLEALTTIRPHRGWRNSASSGETEAVDYVVRELEAMQHLNAWGLELERRPFHTFSGTEFRDTRVVVELAGATVEVPAFGISGHRDRLANALAFDSDGVVNDDEPDPVVVQGTPVIIRSASQLQALSTLAGQVAVVSFAILDRSVISLSDARERAQQLLDLDPAAIVCVTTYSNLNGASHGTFAGDLPVWTLFDGPLPPILNLRLEDAEAAGIDGWDGLAAAQSMQVVWDMDVFSPADSEYLVARIPGKDSSLALILGAHIDSPNNPGGIDNGSGAVTLLQVAEGFDAARARPPIDLYLVWFGSHERGLYGSSSFIADHQELLDRSLAMLQMDCLSVPIDDVTPYLNLVTWPYGRFGDAHMTWPNYLRQAAAAHGVSTSPLPYYGIESDNTNFTAWDVPNANLIFMDPYDPAEVHYAGHMHDPYDEVELVRTETDTLVSMAVVMMTAAVEAGVDRPALRVTPTPDRRALFVASHTESQHMTPTHLVDLSMALAWNGFDVDMVPYGQELVAADLEAADLVVVLPVHDYPFADSDPDQYDEAFSDDELALLEGYAEAGGLLVVANSAHRLKYFNTVYESNEDWPDLNPLVEHFGVRFEEGIIAGDEIRISATHPLTAGLTWLTMAESNGVPFTTSRGRVLAEMGNDPAMVLVPAGAGEMLVLADLGILGNGAAEPRNLRFFSNLAQYARSR